MYNWKALCSDRDGYGTLHDVLRSGRGVYIMENVMLPDTCRNKVCSIEFRYYSEQNIELLYSNVPTEYSGSDTEIETWLRTGKATFHNFNELAEFLARFQNDTVTAPEEDSVPEPPPVRYDRTKVTVPKAENDLLLIDKDALERAVNSQIFGQEENVRKIVHLVCNHIGTKHKSRPLSVFLYGQTGVGKSAVVEALVNEINRQLKGKAAFAYRPVDCTQFQERSDISRLTGAAPGYIGHDEPGVFSVLEQNANTFLVFEEIEKAAPNVTEVIMQAMETGRQETNGKTLSNGKQYYDLSQSVIFFTSNLEVGEKKPALGFAEPEQAAPEEEEEAACETNVARLIGRETKAAKEALAATGKIRREVIGRMNAILHFNPIPDDAVVDIAAKCISDIAAKDHFLFVTRLDESLLQEFLDETAAEVKQFGVRALRNEAQYYFSDALREFSHSHDDYAHISLSGSLDDIRITPDAEE